MRIWYSLILVIIGGASLLGQQLVVHDAETGQPIERASITHLKSMAYATANEKGEINFRAFKVARPSDRFKVRSLGYQVRILTKSEISDLNKRIALQPQAYSLDQVVISATRWSQSSRDLPMQVKSISPKEIKIQNPQTTADILGQSGDVFIQKSQQGGGSPMIRGFATNRLLIAVDGVRMNNAIFRSGNVQNIISLDPFATERAEVFFGPGSVIYGSDAIGGVMSFSTLTPQLATGDSLEVSGRFTSRYASASQEFTNHIDLNVGGEKWAARTSISQFNFGDLRMGRHGPDEYLRSFYVQRMDSTDRVVRNDDPLVQNPTGYTQANLMQKVRFSPSAHWDFTYAFHYSETSDVPRYDRAIRTRNNSPRSAEWYYGPQVWQMNYLKMTHSGSNFLFDKSNVRLAHQEFRESRHDRNFGDEWLRHRREKVNAYSANLDLLKKIGQHHRIYYGTEIVHNEVRSRGSEENIDNGETRDAADRYPQSSWATYAAYINHEWEISPKLTSQTGARYTFYSVEADFRNNKEFYPLPFDEASLNKGAMTGNAGLSYNPAPSWSLRFNLGSAFRAPNVDDIGKIFDSGRDLVVVPNPGLQAEYAYNAEIGAAKVIAEKLKLDASLFFTYLDQAMVRRPFQLNGRDSIPYDGEQSQVQAVQNAASAHVYGVQLSADWQINELLAFKNRFNFQRGREETDDGTVTPSRHAAPWFGQSRLEYEKNKLRVMCYLQMSGAVPADDLNFEERSKPFIYASNEDGEPYSPGWYTVNLKANYTLNEWLTMGGGVENITDQRYRPYSSGIVAPGRNFMMSMQASF